MPFISNLRAAAEQFDYGWEERWIRDEGISKIVPGAVTQLLQRLAIDTERVRFFGMAAVPPLADKLTAKALGLAPDRVVPDLQGTVGTPERRALCCCWSRHWRAPYPVM